MVLAVLRLTTMMFHKKVKLAKLTASCFYNIAEMHFYAFYLVESAGYQSGLFLQDEYILKHG